MGEIKHRLAVLLSMDLDQLCDEWQTCFREVAPALPLSLLRRALAHHLQEKAFGSLPPTAVQTLTKLADDPSARRTQPEIRLKAGTRLLREWNGTVHAVLVVDDGFEWSGARYRSLSEIARKITGAHWSGPRFFGLKRQSVPPSQRKAANG